MTADRGPSAALLSERREQTRLDARRARRRRIARWAGGLAAVGAVFFLGIALGRAIEGTPDPGGTQTFVRTLEPDTLPPVTRTVTVTTSGP